MNETLQTIFNLHTTHGNFSEKEVTREDLDTILKAAVQAASASNMQSYSMIVVEDRKIIKERFDYEGSKAILFCVDFNRLYEAAKVLNHSFRINGIEDFVMGSTDAILAAQTAVTAARALGIDSLITNSVHRHPHQETFEAFHLPNRYCFPILTVIFGYSNELWEEKRGRLLNEGVIHYGVYQQPNETELQSMIEVYDSTDRNLGMNPDWPTQGYNHYLDWFFTKWRGETPDSKKEAYLSTIQKTFEL